MSCRESLEVPLSSVRFSQTLKMTEKTNPSLQRSFQFRTLKKEQLTEIHQGSLEILDRTGMRFFHPEALEAFQQAGITVEDSNLVKIHPEKVEWALNTAPAEISIYDQLGQPAFTLGDDRSYFGVGSDCMYIYDIETGLRRKAVLDDVIHGIRLADALPHLDFVMSMFLPSDVPDEAYERHQFKVMLQESTKPIVYVGVEGASTKSATKMAAAVSGSLERLSERPFAINYVNTVSPFHHNQESVDRLLYAAKRNLPTIYAPGNLAGMTSPITPAGMLALGNAGQLAGLVLSQLIKEGSPFLRSNPAGGCMDMRSMVNLYSAPDCGPLGWDLARGQGLPIFGTAGCSDAKIFDAQAAAEASLSLITNVLGGAHLIHDIGYLDNAMTGSLELTAFCNEVISWLKSYFEEPEINSDTLALDLIHDIGPDGTFLESEHTFRHVFQAWNPDLFDRKSYAQWIMEGGSTFKERANQEVREILQVHRAQPLDSSTNAVLENLIQENLS